MKTVTCPVAGCISDAPEEWRPIPGWEGLYEVSDHGRVRGLDRVVLCANGRARHNAGQMMACAVDGRGRRAVSLKRPGQTLRRWVHSLVLMAFVGPRPDGFEGCHNDGNQLNDHLSNLRWDTVSENRLDMVRHGTHRLSRRTHCPSGHPLQHPNLVTSMLTSGARPGRKCKACHRAQATVSNAKRSGRVVGDRQAIADKHYEKIMREHHAG